MVTNSLPFSPVPTNIKYCAKNLLGSEWRPEFLKKTDQMEMIIRCHRLSPDRFLAIAEMVTVIVISTGT